MARQAVTKAAEEQEIGWKKVESADVLSPSDWEVEVSEVFPKSSRKDPGMPRIRGTFPKVFRFHPGLQESSFTSLTFSPKKEITKPPQNC